MKITLAVLAAGLGSRFGADKQIVPIYGDSILLDYSIADAFAAGFDNVVLIVRSEIEAQMKAHLLKKFPADKLSFVCQDTMTPKEIERKKPWGTGHALLCLKELVHNPFLIINADDFYGAYSFEMMADALRKGKEKTFFSAGYRLGNTLSENGTVSRGICTVSEDHHLISIEERTKLLKTDENEATDERTGERFPLTSFVSMNFWGFTPDIFQLGVPLFETFIAEHKGDPKAEFYIPTLVSHAMAQGYVVEVVPTEAVWFGMTYQEDLEVVRREIERVNSEK